MSATKGEGDTYSATLPSGTTASGTIVAVPTVSGADVTVTPTSFSGLVDGDEKTATIKVKSMNGKVTKNYTLTITVEETEE